MPAPNWYHPVDYTDLLALRSLPSETRWTFVELFCGELGTKTGVVEIRVALIADELRRSSADVTSDLDALEQAGLIVLDRVGRIAYHVGHLLRHPATNDKHRAGWQSQIAAMRRGSATLAALQELDGIAYLAPEIPYREPIDRVSIQEQDRKPEQDHKPEHPLVAVAPVSVPRAKPEKPSIEAEVDTLIAAYNSTCPSLARCAGKPGSESRKEAIKAWRREPDLEVWRKRFEAADASDWLSGRAGKFRADLIWILNQANAEKIDLGRYENRSGQPSKRAAPPVPPAPAPVAAAPVLDAAAQQLIDAKEMSKGGYIKKYGEAAWELIRVARNEAYWSMS